MGGTTRALSPLDGTIACWGRNQAGQAESPPGNFARVGSGAFHTCAIKVDGTVACWGSGAWGAASPPAGSFTQVSGNQLNLTSRSHSCGLKADESLACWGANVDGQATPLPGTFSQVSTGGDYTCALRADDGSIACWGSNAHGEATPPPGAFAQISAGGVHACALRWNGTIACWGVDGDDGRATPPAEFAGNAPQLITFTSTPPAPALLGGTYAVSATGGASSNPVVFSTLTPGVCTISGSTVSLLAVGTCTVAADQAGSVGHEPAVQVTQSFLVAKAPQVIIFTSTVPNPALLGGTHMVTATGGASENPVVFSTLTPAVCTVSGSSVSLVAVGACVIAADQVGDANYEDAPRATQTFNVVYPFAGFFLPVRNPPAMSLGLGGLPVLVPFSLGGDHGFAILAAGSPASRPIDCTTKAPLGDFQPTTAAGVGLYYVAFAKRYVYLWKTEPAWAGTCRELVVTLNDGTAHPATFRFVARDEDDN